MHAWRQAMILSPEGGLMMIGASVGSKYFVSSPISPRGDLAKWVCTFGKVSVHFWQSEYALLAKWVCTFGKVSMHFWQSQYAPLAEWVYSFIVYPNHVQRKKCAMKFSKQLLKAKFSFVMFIVCIDNSWKESEKKCEY